MAALTAPAMLALAARGERDNTSPFPDAEAGDAGAKFRNLAAKFVTQHAAGLEAKAKLHGMEIGPANPAIVDLEQHFSGSRRGCWHFAQFNAVGACIQDGFHGYASPPERSST